MSICRNHKKKLTFNHFPAFKHFRFPFLNKVSYCKKKKCLLGILGNERCLNKDFCIDYEI